MFPENKDNEVMLARIDERTRNLVDKIDALEDHVKDAYVRKDEFNSLKAQVDNNTKVRNAVIAFIGMSFLTALGALVFTGGV